MLDYLTVKHRPNRFAQKIFDVKHCAKPVKLGAERIKLCANVLKLCANPFVQCAKTLKLCAKPIKHCTKPFVQCANAILHCANLLKHCANAFAHLQTPLKFCPNPSQYRHFRTNRRKSPFIYCSNCVIENTQSVCKLKALCVSAGFASPKNANP